MKLIVDTDAGFDVDDVGAVAVANALQDNGECEIVAVAHTNGYNLAIGAVSSIMHFYDRDDVPLGAYKGPWVRTLGPGIINDCSKHRVVASSYQFFACGAAKSASVLGATNSPGVVPK